MTDESAPPDKGAEGRLTLTDEQEDALKDIAAGKGEPLTLAKVLRPVAHFLETYPPANADTEHAWIVRGLVQISSPDAFTLVESERVSVDQAAQIGHLARDAFVYRYPSEACEDFQIRAMTRLAEGKPVSAKFAAYFKNPIEEVANDVINEQRNKQRRLDCERIWNDTYWKFWTVLSWIAFRDINQLCEDRDGFKGLTRYAQASQKEPYPERLLLAALKNGELEAIRDGKKVPVLYWADKDEVDREARFARIDVRGCWPPLDLRDELDRAHDAYVDRNGNDEWDGFGEPCWTHAQTIIWRVTRDPGAVDKASADSARRSLGDDYARGLGAAVIEMLGINIGEVKDAARELRRLCLAGELTAYDRSGDAIDKMAWLPLEIVLDTENRLWITRNGQSVAGDVMFQRVDVLRVWPALPATGDGLVDAYADVVKHYEDEGRRRSGLDRRAKRIGRIVQRLEKPALKDRTHFRLSKIIDHCVPDSPEKRAVYIQAFVLALEARMFNEGKRQKSQLFCTDDAAPFYMRLDQESLMMHLSDIAAVAGRAQKDPDQYRVQKLERLVEHTWMPRRFITRWLTAYKLSPPFWLEDASPAASKPGNEASSGASTDRPVAASLEGREVQATPDVVSYLGNHPKRIICSRSPYQTDIDLWQGYNPAFEDLNKAVALDIQAAAEQLKIDMTPKRETALRDLAAGKGYAKDIIEALRPVPYLLGARSLPRPCTPRATAIRELLQFTNDPERDGFDDPYWTLGQTVLWAATGDRWAVHEASNNSGELGENYWQHKTYLLIDALDLSRVRIQREASGLRRLCLGGRMTAIDRVTGEPISKAEWLSMRIVLDTSGTLIVEVERHSLIAPAPRRIVFARDEVLREFPPEEPSEDQDVTALQPADTSGQDIAEPHSGDDGASALSGASTNEQFVGDEPGRGDADASNSISPTAGERSTPQKRQARQPKWDFGMACQFVEQEWRDRGDPCLLQNAEDGWRSDEDIVTAAGNFLKKLQPELPRPDQSWVRKKLKKTIENLRKNNREKAE